jgi:hypothetical protein
MNPDSTALDSSQKGNPATHECTENRHLCRIWPGPPCAHRSHIITAGIGSSQLQQMSNEIQRQPVGNDAASPFNQLPPLFRLRRPLLPTQGRHCP